ncbi:MAG TPA: hypothetical protein VK021_01465 [Flavobacteriaceae bacterium]|nr:hypothetical protein [Flavobacteriaceae bacterium]
MRHPFFVVESFLWKGGLVFEVGFFKEVKLTKKDIAESATPDFGVGN